MKNQSTTPVVRPTQNPLRHVKFIRRPLFVAAAKRGLIDELLEEFDELSEREVQSGEGQEFLDAIEKVKDLKDVLGIRDYLLSSELHAYSDGEDVWSAIIDYALS